MDYKKWIDSVIEAQRDLVMLDETSDEYIGICICGMYYQSKMYVHLSGDIERVAEAVGTEVKCREHNEIFDKYYFDYDGCEIYVLRRKQ